MDLFDLKVVGWSYGLNMTETLVINALNKALINRELNKEGIFHSDRGSQYTSNNFEKLLTSLNIKHNYFSLSSNIFLISSPIFSARIGGTELPI